MKLFHNEQANKDIRSWTSQESVQGETVWMSNRRILTLLTELLRLKRVLPVVQAIAKASEVLLRATDGLKLEVEGCVLPQLEVCLALNVVATWWIRCPLLQQASIALRPSGRFCSNRD